ncbi:hypothetical protein [Mycobacterium sp. 48b]|uniref:hypothetical protein n=1 Tax=Mycobacterium sp. 48b TaxID=3400426 RepID=UPI003AAC71A7
MSQPSQRRQFAIDAADARYIFTALPVIDPNVDGYLLSFTDVQDFRRIPRPQPETGDCEHGRTK